MYIYTHTHTHTHTHTEDVSEKLILFHNLTTRPFLIQIISNFNSI